MVFFPPEIIKRLSQAQKVVVLTGAGISAESGLSTFRGAGGQWDKVDPFKLATPEAFAKDPLYVWEWVEARRRQLREAEPNMGHEVIAGMENYFPQLTLITQNVDRLHQKAGSRNPLELHGSIWMVRCTAGCGEWEDRHELVNLPPKCPHCGALVRPGVVWFGESLPVHVWEEAAKAAKDCDAFLVIGTSALVQPAATLPDEAIQKGKLVIEINPEDTPLSKLASHSVRAKAGEALEYLREKLLSDEK